MTADRTRLTAIMFVRTIRHSSGGHGGKVSVRVVKSVRRGPKAEQRVAEGRELQIRRFSGPSASPVVHEKTLSRRVDRILKQQEEGKLKVPAVNHPWRELA